VKLHETANHPTVLAACELADSDTERLAVVLYADNHHVQYVADGETGEDLLEVVRESFRGAWSGGAEYAQELAEQVGEVPSDLPWPLSCIDWEGAYGELTMGGDVWDVNVDALSPHDDSLFPDADAGLYVFASI
jgi:hypothetical protein